MSANSTRLRSSEQIGIEAMIVATVRSLAKPAVQFQGYVQHVYAGSSKQADTALQH